MFVLCWLRGLSAVKINEYYLLLLNTTSGQRIFIKGRIAIFSPLAAANRFVRNLDHHLTSVSLDPHKSAPKRHLDRLKWTVFANSAAKFLNGADNPEIALPIGRSGPHLTHGSLGPPESAFKRHLDRFSRFTGYSRVLNTETQRPRYVRHLSQ